MKLFSTKTHGVLDYLTAGTLLALPRMLGWSRSATNLMTTMALGTVGYSLITDYELGPLKLLPFRGHLALDAMSAALFCAAPLLFADEESSVKGSMFAIGLFELLASASTETVPERNQGYVLAA